MVSFRRFLKGILLHPTDVGPNPAVADPTDNLEGSMWVYGTKIKTYIGAAIREIVTSSQSQTLTNKTIDGDDNTVQDLPITALKTVLGDANKFLSRDSSGIPTSAKAVPTGDVVGTSDSQALTNKTIDGDNNTIQDVPITALKTVLGDASKFIARDAAGAVVSTKAVPVGDVVGTSDSQALTNKTIDGDSNTVQDIGISSLKTVLADASKFIARDGTGAVVSTKSVPTGDVVGTSDSQNLSNKTFISTQPAFQLGLDLQDGVSNKVGLVAGSGTAAYDITLPVAAPGDNKYLKHTTSGTYTWADAASGGGSTSMNYGSILAGEQFTGATLPQSCYLKREKMLNVSSTVKYLDIIENGGSEVSVAIPELYYLIKDLGTADTTYDLMKVMSDTLTNNVSLAGTYTVSYNADTRKVTIAATGITTLTINVKTGTHGGDNLNTEILNGLLGFANADLSGALTYTAGSTIDSNVIIKAVVYKTDTDFIYSSNVSGLVTENANKMATVTPKFGGIETSFTGLTEGLRYYTGPTAGTLVAETSTLAPTASFVGVAPSETSLSYNLAPNIINYANDWLSVPLDKDWSVETFNVGQAETSDGKGVRVALDMSSTGSYRIQYKTANGTSWVDSATTIAWRASGSGSMPAEDSRDFTTYCRVKADPQDSNKFVMAVVRHDGSNLVPYAYYSNDAGATFTACNSGSALSTGSDKIISGLAIRQTKAVIQIANTARTASYWSVSTNSGSGYTTFSALTTMTNGILRYDYPAAVFIRYDGTQAGDAKWQICSFGMNNSNDYVYCLTCDGVLANQGSSVQPLSTNTRFPESIAMDSAGTGNRIFISGVASSAGNAPINCAISNDYTGSAISFTSKGDVNSGGSNVSAYYWHNDNTGGISYQYIPNLENRAVLNGSFCAFVASTLANIGGKIELGLWYNKNIDSSSFETKIDIGGDQDNYEYVMGFLASQNALVVAYKYMPTAAIANIFSNGQIFAKYISIDGTNTVHLMDTLQIDNSKAESGFEGNLRLSSSLSNINLSWEHYNGSTRDTVWSNRFY